MNSLNETPQDAATNQTAPGIVPPGIDQPTAVAASITRHGLWPAIIALTSWAIVASSIDAVGNYPQLGEGPGLTSDEPLNVSAGYRLFEGTWGWVIGRYTLRDVWDDVPAVGRRSGLGTYKPDYPPLGRLWLGAFERLAPHLLTPHLPTRRTVPWVTVCSRFASATAFAWLVYLVGSTASRWYGRLPGAAAAVSLVLMPRVFGHAHLACVESAIGLVYGWTVLHVARHWNPSTVTRWTTPVGAGVITGLALLTKIQAVFLGPVIALWCLYHGGRKAIRGVLLWGVTALAIMFVGWPWLWLDPLSHSIEYFAQTTERVQLYVWYFGEKIADRDVPWHYVPLMFATTVPIGLHAFGVLGLWRCFREGITPAEQLTLAGLLAPMIVLSIPGIAVYDGPRLFLVSFPLWAIFIGRGVSATTEFLVQRLDRSVSIVGVWLVIAMQGYGLVQMKPCYLSYYNLLVGGTSGAKQVGLEVTYWGDSVTRTFIAEVVKQVPRGSTIHIKPVMHPAHPRDLIAQSPILANHGIRFVPYNPSERPRVRFWLVFRRNADLTPDLRGQSPGRVLTEVRRAGVQLAALIASKPRSERGKIPNVD